ncbi:MAG: polysaccharide deacetylase family protein [Armatimonadetes bacterium]|nr:polysaccharide deacetylase family protein [Armatimonadota bacterium]
MRTLVAAGLCLCAALTGIAEPGPAHAPRSAGNRVTNRKANPRGRVLIVMYHATGPEEKYMVRSRKNFKKDLQRLYDMGYRPITLAEYANSKYDIPPGSSPVVMTFDDSRDSQFQLRKDGSIDPDCMVGMWKEFAKTHADFPVKGTFFMLPNGPFGSKKTGKAKVKALKDWGCELASHTLTHPFLNKLSGDNVKRELAGSIEWLRKFGVEATTVALPYGVPPRDQSVFKGFKWKGQTFRFRAVAFAGAWPARSTADPQCDLYQVPRVEASEKAGGLTVWLDRVQAGKSKPLVVP